MHPHDVEKKSNFNKDFIIDEFKKNNKIIGVGETGLDFYYENSPKKIQIDSFRVHIEASIECNCPLIVHSRDAEDITFEILDEYKDQNIKNFNALLYWIRKTLQKN